MYITHLFAHFKQHNNNQAYINLSDAIERFQYGGTFAKSKALYELIQTMLKYQIVGEVVDFTTGLKLYPGGHGNYDIGFYTSAGENADTIADAVGGHFGIEAGHDLLGSSKEMVPIRSANQLVKILAVDAMGRSMMMLNDRDIDVTEFHCAGNSMIIDGSDRVVKELKVVDDGQSLFELLAMLKIPNVSTALLIEEIFMTALHDHLKEQRF